MANNKVIYGNDVLMDITDTTADENSVLEGATFYGADGEKKIGNMITRKMTDTTKEDFDDLVAQSEDGDLIIVTDEEGGGGGGGGSTVKVKAIETEGTHIADIIVDGEKTELYAPEGNAMEWSGTQAEWDALDKSTIQDGTTVIITDDYDNILMWQGTREAWDLTDHSKIPNNALVVITNDYNSDVCNTVASCLASTEPNDVAGASAVAEINDYSKDDVPIGKWINSKPLYRKAVEIPSIATGSWNSTPHGISNIEEICSVKAIVRYTDGVGGISMGAIYNSTASNIQTLVAFVDGTNVEIRTNASSYIGQKAIVIFEYTKTTD